tara:strand:+ start:2382 stop:3095 length:714 start_codon:yes stop_codon:yes gene_type:complete
MKYFTFNIIFLLLLSTHQFSQNLEDKNVLVVWGGWDGHKPEKFANIIEDWLKIQNINYEIAEGVEVYDDLNYLLKYDLIIQSVTMGELDGKQEENLTKAVRSGVGIAGTHGGLGDSFRNNTNYQFMIGGQFVSHPGNKVKFEVEILKDELTIGVNNFEVETEQYYMHVDPNIDIIAQSRFTNHPHSWIENVIMPVAWKKKYGNGKIFYISLGHDPNEFLKYEEAMTLLTRGFIWALR